MARESQRRALGEGPVRIGAVVALSAAVAFLLWLLVRNRDDDSSTTGTTTTATTRGANLVVAATLPRLRRLQTVVGHPIYWAGARRGVTYELTQTRDGRIYIRYLPRGVKVGDRKGGYLIVGTYPVPNAYKAVQTAARQNGAHTLGLGSRGLAVYNDTSATNIYFAEPGSDYQVEVYEPNAARARALVTSGAIRPIR